MFQFGLAYSIVVRIIGSNITLLWCAKFHPSFAAFHEG